MNTPAECFASQDYIISYCRSTDGESGAAAGTINVSHILTGRCVAKITGDTAKGKNALHDVTSIFYNEDRNELYVGNRQGMLSIFAQ